mmetsp:Transcript_1143/g.2562  ORF Transcript_1143/g.2562 Transcript_1143/m.2562 type:complete len:261 (-) Transcript_1143:166-948(-)
MPNVGFDGGCWLGPPAPQLLAGTTLSLLSSSFSSSLVGSLPSKGGLNVPNGTSRIPERLPLLLLLLLLLLLGAHQAPTDLCAASLEARPQSGWACCDAWLLELPLQRPDSCSPRMACTGLKTAHPQCSSCLHWSPAAAVGDASPPGTHVHSAHLPAPDACWRPGCSETGNSWSATRRIAGWAHFLGAPGSAAGLAAACAPSAAPLSDHVRRRAATTSSVAAASPCWLACAPPIAAHTPGQTSRSDRFHCCCCAAAGTGCC